MVHQFLFFTQLTLKFVHGPSLYVFVAYYLEHVGLVLAP